MMKTHIVENGIVCNTILATVEEAQAAFPSAICIDGESGEIGWTWDGETLAPPAVDLQALKISKNDEINAARFSANFSAFPYAGKLIACDTLSRSDIDGINGYVSLNSALPPGWPGGWKATDNSILIIGDVATWKAFYGAMIAAGSANFAHAQALKAALIAATTAEEIAAIVW